MHPPSSNYVPKTGDILLVYVTVERDAEPGDQAIMVSTGADNPLDADADWMLWRRHVAGIHQMVPRPAPLTAGDIVMLNNDDTYSPKIVRGVFDGYVWISDQSGHQMRTVTTNLVHRVTNADHL